MKSSRVQNHIQNMAPWDGQDRKRLAAWIGGNQYRSAFLIHTVPIKPNTLERILRGYHDPGSLLSARLRDLIERYPSGSALPHPAGLI